MELFMNLMYILVTSVLVENVVLAKFLGCCPFLGVSKKLDSAVGMSSAVIFVMLMATAVTWPIYTYLLAPQGLDYLQTIVFILVIAALVQLVEFILKKYMKPLYRSLGVYLPLITTNCAVLGSALTNVQKEYNFIFSVANGFGTAVGFTIAIVLLASIRESIEDNDIPFNFKGSPSVLITSGLMAIAFMGFSGLI